MEKLNEKCAVFGIYGRGLDAARLTYFGLYALQHRGQESSGISTGDGKTIKTHKSTGLVAQVYTEDDLHKLQGYIAIGHNRYSTSGGSLFQHTQPVTDKDNILITAHNGNLPRLEKLKGFLVEKGIDTEGFNDTEHIHSTVSWYLKHGETLENAIAKTFPLMTGAFSLLFMTKDKVAAVRDSYGIRPLSIGTLNGGYIFSSETCALDTVSAKNLRDVTPGELVVISEKGLKSQILAKPNQKLDIFEFVYFSRPDSKLLGKRVYKMRENLGKLLAKEYPIKADVVIPVPESSIPAATGYANALKIPLEFGLVKNRYIGRTFIMPDQKLRDRGVQMKLNPIEELIIGKKVVLIDDSIVRGTTSKKIVSMVRNAGAKEVHLLISSPPVKYPDFYGINTPFQKDLIAANMTVSEIEKFVGADSLNFLSYEALIKATELPESLFCTSCFTGKYPIDIGDNAKHIRFGV
ncbi:MAG: amidophosphoribosyltransferase [Candidatus Levyibacteriota bacterium]|nr:MAG: amidophosphoribosyltransferase [Candidatus Levybacteria bacterium]